MPVNKRKVAVFDVDGTIFRSSLVIHITEALIEAGLFPKGVRSEYSRLESDWHARSGSYEDYINALVATFMANIKGVAYSDFARITEEVVDRERLKIYKFTRDLVAELKKDAYFLLAVSHSPKHALDVFLLALGFDKVYGRVYEVGPENRLTGVIADMHLIENKANIVRRAVDKNNLTLEGSVAVGDTEGDISMLELVERPIAFNPNMKLYKHAKRMGWEIVVERKDVIYKI
jgi:HAD superfamily phosphoserine phosphatase-like hydrolase